MPIIVVGCIGVWIFAEPFCALLLGEKFRSSGTILRLLMPIVAITLPSYIFGFPVLSPMGLAKYANISTIVGSIVQLVNLMILFLSGYLNVRTICIATCITETIVLLFRVIIVIRNRHLLGSQLLKVRLSNALKHIPHRRYLRIINMIQFNDSRFTRPFIFFKLLFFQKVVQIQNVCL